MAGWNDKNKLSRDERLYNALSIVAVLIMIVTLALTCIGLGGGVGFWIVLLSSL